MQTIVKGRYDARLLAIIQAIEELESRGEKTIEIKTINDILSNPRWVLVETRQGTRAEIAEPGTPIMRGQ